MNVITTACADAAPCRPGPLTRRRSAAPLAPRASGLSPYSKFIRAIRAIRGQSDLPRGAGVLACRLPHRPGASSAFPRPQTPDPRPFLAQSLKPASLSGLHCVSVPQWLISFASSRLAPSGQDRLCVKSGHPFWPRAPRLVPRASPATSGYIRVHPANKKNKKI